MFGAWDICLDPLVVSLAQVHCAEDHCADVSAGETTAPVFPADKTLVLCRASQVLRPHAAEPGLVDTLLCDTGQLHILAQMVYESQLSGSAAAGEASCSPADADAARAAMAEGLCLFPSLLCDCMRMPSPCRRHDLQCSKRPRKMHN
jgi:hypothetical protein